MFRPFSLTVIGHETVYLKHKFVSKLNIINLIAHKFYTLIFNYV